jgi:hypothetical protein
MGITCSMHKMRNGYIILVGRCRGIGMTYKTGFGLDDWIYCNLYIHKSGLQPITALLLSYTLYSSPLHTRVLTFH